MRIKSKILEYGEYAPVYLITLDPTIMSDIEFNQLEVTANTNQTFMTGIKCVSPSANEKLKFMLDGNYKRLTGYIIIPYENKDEDVDRWWGADGGPISIYFDDVLKYRSPLIYGGDAPVFFEIDVSGCNMLHIDFTGYQWVFELAEIKLWKK